MVATEQHGRGSAIGTTGSIDRIAEDESVRHDMFFLEGLVLETARQQMPLQERQAMEARDRTLTETISYISSAIGADAYTKEIATLVARMPRQDTTPARHAEQALNLVRRTASQHDHAFSSAMHAYLARAEEPRYANTVLQLAFAADTLAYLRSRGYAQADALQQLAVRYASSTPMAKAIDGYRQQAVHQAQTAN